MRLGSWRQHYVLPPAALYVPAVPAAAAPSVKMVLTPMYAALTVPRALLLNLLAAHLSHRRQLVVDVQTYKRLILSPTRPRSSQHFSMIMSLTLTMPLIHDTRITTKT